PQPTHHTQRGFIHAQETRANLARSHTISARFITNHAHIIIISNRTVTVLVRGPPARTLPAAVAPLSTLAGALELCSGGPPPGRCATTGAAQLTTSRSALSDQC